jgi:hypothetical protein
MAYPPLPPKEGGEPSDATRGAGVRLGDAGQITADKLDLNDDRPLEDALAGAVANGTQDEIQRLTKRIGAAQARYAVPNGDASSLPQLAEPASQGLPSQPSEGTLLGLRDWSGSRATVAAELAEIQSQPLFLKAEQQQMGGGTHWHPAEQDAEPYHPVQQEPAEPVQTATPEVALITEPPLPVPLVAEPLVPDPPAPEPPVSELAQSERPLFEPMDVQSPDTSADAPLAEPTLAEPARPQSLHARLEASQPESVLADASRPEASRPQSLSARLEAPLPEPPLTEPPQAQSVNEAAVTPIASALDAAAKLAADADAAATALENLSRMLQAHQRPASMVPSPGQHAALRPMHPGARPGTPNSRPMPTPPRSVMPDGDPLQMASPRPEHRPVQRIMRPAPAEVPAARPVRPPTLRPAPIPRNTRQFDLRGFMAGFAIAGAMGALLYIYLMTG